VSPLEADAQTKSLHDRDPLESNARWQLALRVAAAPQFARAARLRDFLLYVCRNALTHHTQEIHEQQIGAEVFGRRSDYNPAEDNIVRVEAREVRKRLAQYFAGDGSAEPIRITIPKGSYVPLFESQAPVSAGAGTDRNADGENPGGDVNRLVASEGVRRGMRVAIEGPDRETVSRRLWHAALVVALAGVGLAAILYWEPTRVSALLPRTSASSASPALQPQASLWPELFPSGSRINIVVADSALVLVEDITHTTVSLTDYMSRNYERTLKGPEVPLIAGRPYTDLADVMVTSKLLRAIHRQPLLPLVRYPRDLTFRDLENDNLVFLGSAYSDPWVGEFDAQAEFRIVKNPVTGFLCFANTLPLPGEGERYCASPVASGGLETYALVTFMPNLQDTGNVLILEGTTGAGTEAAGDFMTNPHYSSRLRALLGVRAEAKSLPYFQLLLRAIVLDNTPGELRVVARRFLQKTARPK
jgi:hypothetical protein